MHRLEKKLPIKNEGAFNDFVKVLKIGEKVEGSDQLGNTLRQRSLNAYRFLCEDAPRGPSVSTRNNRNRGKNGQVFRGVGTARDDCTRGSKRSRAAKDQFPYGDSHDRQGRTNGGSTTSAEKRQRTSDFRATSATCYSGLMMRDHTSAEAMAQRLGSLPKGNIDQSQPIPIHFASAGPPEENSLQMLSATEMEQTPHGFTNDIVNYLPTYAEAEVGSNSYLPTYAEAGDVLAGAASGSHLDTECLVGSNSYLPTYINAGSVLMSEVPNIGSESGATAGAVGYFPTL